MKKTFVFCSLVISTGLYALPQPADQLITSLVTVNKEFSMLLTNHISNNEYTSNFNTLSITKVNDIETHKVLSVKCPAVNSKSGSILKVNLDDKVFYFVTDRSAENMHYCSIE